MDICNEGTILNRDLYGSTQSRRCVDQNYDALTAVGQQRSTISDSSERSRVLSQLVDIINMLAVQLLSKGQSSD